MKKISGILVLAILAILAGCKNGGNGELVGAKNRPDFYADYMPHGMVFIPLGNFMMGTGDQDASYSYTTQAKRVTVASFYMDETEITNNEYRQFVEWVRDSIAHILLANADVDADDPDKAHLRVYEDGDNAGEPMDPPLINWKSKIKWDSKDEEYQEALSPLFETIDGRFYHIDPVALNTKILDYEYWWIDKTKHTRIAKGAAYKEHDVQSPETKNKGMFTNRPTAYDKGRSAFIRHEVVNIYPDTLVWNHDFTYSFNEPMTNNYFCHTAYDHYPVVGVSWVQAKAFCNWRTKLRNVYLRSEGLATEEEFRLPSEMEWEYASRGGLAQNPYPWGGPYTSNKNGCFLANFKPQRGAYELDGALYPCIVAHYHPNDFGLYDMAGNVAEWCEDAYDESAYNFAHDFNMQYTFTARDEDPIRNKRKTIRGDSWKDISHYIQLTSRSYEYQDTAKSYIGFRCVQSYIGRHRDDNNGTASHIY